MLLQDLEKLAEGLGCGLSYLANKLANRLTLRGLLLRRIEKLTDKIFPRNHRWGHINLSIHIKANFDGSPVFSQDHHPSARR